MLLTTCEYADAMFWFTLMHASGCLWISITMQLEIACYYYGDSFFYKLDISLDI
jgi:hypothetical protein